MTEILWQHIEWPPEQHVVDTVQAGRGAADDAVREATRSGNSSPIARQEWNRLAAELSKLNLITHLDRGALASYCGAYALWAEAMVQIQKYGTMVKSPTGYPMQSPYLGLANRQAELMMRIATEFGFMPASHSRISTPPPDQLPLLDIATDEYDEKQPEVGGSQILGDRSSRGPAPISFRDFFPSAAVFQGQRAGEVAFRQLTSMKSFAV